MIPKNQAQYEFYLASEILQDSFVEIDCNHSIFRLDTHVP